MLNADIIIVFVTIAVAVILFIVGWAHYNLVPVPVLHAQAISSVVPMVRAIEGFANPTVELGQPHSMGGSGY